MKKTTLVLLSLGFVSMAFGDNFITIPKPKEEKRVQPSIVEQNNNVPMMDEEIVTPKPMKQKHQQMMGKPMVVDGEQPAPMMHKQPVNMMDNMDKDGFWIQLGAFKYPKKAQNRLDEVSESCGKANIYQKDGLNKVVAGPFGSQEIANSKLRELRKLVKGAFLTHPENFK